MSSVCPRPPGRPRYRRAVTGGTYTFGDSSPAATRLALLAEVFDPATSRLLSGLAGEPPRFAVDLGCGPGSTTALIAERLTPPRLIAIDTSPAFVARAAARLGGRATVLEGDVEALPEVVHGADLIFARFLLTHLRAPVSALEEWVTRLSPRGIVVVQEVDSIVTDEPALERYLALQRRMLAANGQRLDVGPLLDRGDWRQATVVRSDVVTVTPSSATAARLFAMNFAQWRARPKVDALTGGEERDAIAAGLAAVAEGRAPERTITWRLRELVLRPSSHRRWARA